ncbi:cytochrome P450 monooxygenase [Histoplasma capsulatum G186AR]|uniref:Cytochrome P450 monooxygenase n=1 Tax=Ajellomyces capsulatus (strain G186AR / H82 / ATCC MYA-2454 / RMSCC 2432) TaxID=447093 RepID=C0NQX3_AJECG|nr:cytochrome P450 monooxygenase [Histoplasma capsulatum G186AR]EEH06087.1 cytochrome P450 monooxygenase [Histoplasma capsulatum G186AR]
MLHSSMPSTLGLAAIFILLPTLFFQLTLPKKSRLPLINGKKLSEFSYTNSGKRFLKNARILIDEGLGKAKAFRLLTDNGPKTVLSADYADEIRSHPLLNFGAAIAKEFHADIKGLTHSSKELEQTRFSRMPSGCRNVIEPISTEASIILERDWTNNHGWHDIVLKKSALKIVAQLSSRVFLGEKLCRNPDWLRITISYTVNSYIAAQALRLWPEVIRPLVASFLPSCRKLRQEIEEARAIINPVLEERRQAKEAAIRVGKNARALSRCHAVVGRIC